jgi:replicative DNA helicase
MKFSDQYLENARCVLGAYLSQPEATEKEIGELFHPSLFVGQLYPIAQAIHRQKQQNKVKEINDSSIAVLSGCHNLVNSIYIRSGIFNPKHQIEEMIREYGILHSQNGKSEKAPRTLLDAQLAQRAEGALKRLRAGVERLQTGFPELDRALGGGIAVPSIVVLGAKPKCGKSILVDTIADNVVSQGNYAYILDLENGMDRFMRRLMCRRSMLNPDEISKREFLPNDLWNLTEKEVTDGGLGTRLFVDDYRRFSVTHLEHNISEISNMAVEKGKQCIIILDSLQKLPLENLSDRRAGIDRWMRWLEQIRDKYRITIILTSELKRPTQGNEYKPTEVSLKESGDIEYTADLVLSLDRRVKNDEFAVEDGEDAPPATMRIVFNRDGKTGIVADYQLVYPYFGIRELSRHRPLSSIMKEKIANNLIQLKF